MQENIFEDKSQGFPASFEVSEKFITDFNNWREGFEVSPNWERLAKVEQDDVINIDPAGLSPEDQSVFMDVFLNGRKILKEESAIDKYLGKLTIKIPEMCFRHFVTHALYINPNILKEN